METVFEKRRPPYNGCHYYGTEFHKSEYEQFYVLIKRKMVFNGCFLSCLLFYSHPTSDIIFINFFLYLHIFLFICLISRNCFCAYSFIKYFVWLYLLCTSRSREHITRVGLGHDVGSLIKAAVITRFLHLVNRFFIPLASRYVTTGI